MTDRDALFAAILAHPDEDTPRLAYADWLEENGEAEHAGFIRRQIEVAKVPEWDPIAIRAVRLDAEVASGAKWLTLAQNGLGPPAAQTIAKSPCFRNLTILNLEQNPIGNAGVIALAKSPHLTNLLELNLRECSVGDAGVQAILDSPLCERLEHLMLFTGRGTSPAMKRKLRKRMGDRVIP